MVQKYNIIRAALCSNMHNVNIAKIEVFLSYSFSSQILNYEEMPYHNLQSLSTMITVASSGLPDITPVGSDEFIVRIKFSLPSNILSSFIGILNGTLITPAGNVIEYIPEV